MSFGLALKLLCYPQLFIYQLRSLPTRFRAMAYFARYPVLLYLVNLYFCFLKYFSSSLAIFSLLH